MNHITSYLNETMQIISKINRESINDAKNIILKIRENKGRIFFLGIGGSAGNASHAVNDFRKIAGIECYTPTDNASELTARTNDDGWENVFVKWLEGSNLSGKDAIFILSVGGGNIEKGVSVNLIKAIDYANSVNASVLGIVGRSDGYAAKKANVCIIIPEINSKHTTPHAEGFQGIILHLIVTHPDILKNQMKWEGIHIMPSTHLKALRDKK